MLADVPQLGIAVVPEREKVFDTLTVRENLELALVGARARASAEGSSRHRSAEDTFELFPALARLANRDAIFLSGGERQMLAIGACLLSRPRLLIVARPRPSLRPPEDRRVRACDGNGPRTPAAG